MNSHKMKITPEEQDRLDWCFSVLSEEQILQLEEEALEIAEPEMYEEEAADLLLTTFVAINIRTAQAEYRGKAKRKRDD